MLSTQIKTPSQLKSFLANEPHFFTRGTMKFFGDTMANFGLKRVIIFKNDGTNINGYELYRKRPVKHGLQSSHYFAPDGMDKVVKVNGIAHVSIMPWK